MKMRNPRFSFQFYIRLKIESEGSTFLLFYYTDYAGVNALAVGTIMMFSRVFDGISDIIMGIIVDRTKSRFGKALAAAHVHSVCSVWRSPVFRPGRLDIHSQACICVYYL